jgi:hypothetical protein
MDTKDKVQMSPAQPDELITSFFFFFFFFAEGLERIVKNRRYYVLVRSGVVEIVRKSSLNQSMKGTQGKETTTKKKKGGKI